MEMIKENASTFTQHGTTDLAHTLSIMIKNNPTDTHNLFKGNK